MNEKIQRLAKFVAGKHGSTYEERQDIENECLEAAWRATPHLIPGIDPKSYYHKAMQNAAISFIRKKNQIKEICIPDYPGFLALESDDFSSFMSDLEFGEKLRGLISELEYPDNEIVTGLALGLGYDEIAERTKKTVGCIRTRISRNREKWKEIFDKL